MARVARSKSLQIRTCDCRARISLCQYTSDPTQIVASIKSKAPLIGLIAIVVSLFPRRIWFARVYFVRMLICCHSLLDNVFSYSPVKYSDLPFQVSSVI